MSEQIDIEVLVQDMEKSNLINLDSSIIKDVKHKVLQRIVETRDELILYHKLLSHYRYVDEIDELRYGSYIRSFSFKTDEKNKRIVSLKLLKGGFITDIKPVKNDILILCRGGGNRFYNIKMNQSIIFQKNTKQEELLIQILDQMKE